MPSDSLPLTVLQQIDRVCDSFEAAWNAGLKPRIEEYLATSENDHRSILLRELLAREIELRRKVGETPEAAEYVCRFEGHDELIGTLFGELEPREETALLPITSTLRKQDGEPSEFVDETTPATTATRDEQGGEARPRDKAEVVLPERIGRFHPVRLLGRGNFLVFLARDLLHDRDVAVKVARPDDPLGRRRLMSLAEEAQRLAALDHPGIVKVYEFVAPTGEGGAREAGGDGFIVLEYIAGSTLEELFRRERPDPVALARIVAAVAQAVHYAHTAGLVHRDLKPSNILVDVEGQPKVCDFGLAIDEQIQWLRRGEVAGTLPYMAPEQVRGETNRFDGRTDVWAIGVILYRGLTGRLPFRCSSMAEGFEEIQGREPRPPRQYGDDIPRELERICLRCLSRQMTDRYLTAADLAEDLSRWLAARGREPTEAPAPPPAAPKGLRNFGGEDAGFFLSLLSGPRGSDGLPESIRFWKSRIEADEGPRAFSVGLVYGPSGGGKSSFVKAGLLPQLDPGRVRPIDIESSPRGTEEQLRAELQRMVPLLPEDCDLALAIALLRDDVHLRPREKLLLVFDQFEQWLQGRPIEPDSVLVRALRQCDGRNVQALLLVRDDFWMATTRLLRAIEVPLLEGENAAAVELFDGRHARKVLEEFGRSLGQIDPGELPSGGQCAQFLDKAVTGLSGPDGRIIPVRLSVFVEVVRRRPWTLQTLSELGGMEGIGVKFLEQAFDSPSSPPAHRVHRDAAEAVLRLLLPAPASIIRGAARSRRALREASGCTDRPRDFIDLLHVLDHDLRLITAVDVQAPLNPADSLGAEPTAADDETYYQLAHDYLIGPIRQWVQRNLYSSREGRAHLRLQAITATWLQRPGAHRLPSLPEYAGILHHTRRASWSVEERQLMHAATRHYLARLCAVAALFLAAALGGKALLDRFERRSLLSAALSAQDLELPGIIGRLEPYQNHLIVPLEAKEREALPRDRAREVAGMLLYRFAPTVDRGRYLRGLLLAAADPDRVELICQCLATHPELAGLSELRQVALNVAADPAARLRAACALATLEPDRLEKLDAVVAVVTSALLEERRRQIPGWLKLLGSAEHKLVAPLGDICGDREVHSVTRTTAAEALGDILKRSGDAAGLAAVIVDSHPDASEILLRELAGRGSPAKATEFFRSVLAQKIEDPVDDQSKDELAGRSALAAIGLEYLGELGAVRAHLGPRGDPRVRALLIQREAAFSLGRTHLLERLASPDTDPQERQALLMVWAETPLGNVPAAARAEMIRLAQRLFFDDPDPGVHSAAELLLRRFCGAGVVEKCEQELRRRPERKLSGRWMLAPEGHTLAVIPGPLIFQMGSPGSKAAQQSAQERAHFRRIDRSIAVSTKEVTIAQYRAFDPRRGPDGHFTHDLNCPMNGLSWYDAARYCNWLSARGGIPRDQWSYPEKIEPGMVLPEDSVERTGYRLPTEAEWEYVCRAGTVTPRYFGSSEELFPRYGWTWLNSHDRAMPPGLLLPNSLGMFDMLGNLWEWCHDGPVAGRDPPPYPAGTEDKPALDRITSGVIDRSMYRVLRGGAFDYSPAQARAAYRYSVASEYNEGTFGFRVVRTLCGARG
jgi:serine/threonine protein kinase/formylglycine-generating enzyme required for sulfatase activity